MDLDNIACNPSPKTPNADAVVVDVGVDVSVPAAVAVAIVAWMVRCIPI